MMASATAFANLYVRLHRKLASVSSTFHPSWAMGSSRATDFNAWTASVLSASKATSRRALLFDNPVERLALLEPADLARVLCGITALLRNAELRLCIDGTTLKALRDTIGAKYFAAIRQSTATYGANFGPINWQVASLCAEGMANITLALGDDRLEALELIRFGLPQGLPIVPPSCDSRTFDSVFRDSRTLCPELRWLFG